MIAESSSSYLLSPPEPDRQLTATPRCRAENRRSRDKTSPIWLVSITGARFAGSTSRLGRANEPSKRTVVALDVKLDRFCGQLRRSSRPDCASSCAGAAKVAE